MHTLQISYTTCGVSEMSSYRDDVKKIKSKMATMLWENSGEKTEKNSGLVFDHDLFH